MSATLTATVPRSAPRLLTSLVQRLTAPRSESKPRTRTGEAEALREWASNHAQHHRGFQDDLYAAADRHERGVCNC